MSDNLELDRVAEKRSAPAKAWRNKWRVIVAAEHSSDGEAVGPGIHWGKVIFPSKEIAQQHAHNTVDKAKKHNTAHWVEYLGAFPVPTT